MTAYVCCKLSYTSVHSEKEGYSIRKEFAPYGSKFIPYRVASFTEGQLTISTDFASPEIVSMFLKVQLKWRS